jgi:hypothetical protein
MAISTLTKLSVPVSSDQSAGNQTLLMPKLNYRFRVTFDGFGVTNPTTELSRQIIDCTKPNASFQEITMNAYNSQVFLAGRHSWQPISVNIREDATGIVQKLVGEQMQKQFDFYEQSSAASGVDYKFLTRIEILDGGNGAYTPNVLETWEMYGCFLVSANYGNLAYSSNEATQISLSIRYDNAIQTPQGAGIGVNVGRTVGAISTGAG